jgi:P-type Cu2+ transporter
VSAARCYHCGEPCPPGLDLSVDLDGVPQPMCCPGCTAAAELIRDAGLGDFYRFRTALPLRVEPGADATARWQAFDHDEVLARYAHAVSDGTGRPLTEITLTVGGMRCGACAWLIERRLAAVDGVQDLRCQLSSNQVSLRFDRARAPLSTILATIAALGYQPRPALPGDLMAEMERERRTMLRRIAVAGLAMMQVMTYAVGLYFGAFRDMDTDTLDFFRYLSLLLTTPVVIYAAAPFFISAWRGLLARVPGMDLPVSLAVGSAYLASVWNTFGGGGEVYYDSVTMFVFFLSVGRYLELAARKRSLGWTALAAERPALARRLDAGDEATLIPSESLREDDRIQLLAGDLVPADGVMSSGALSTDERLLTGESAAVTHAVGDEIIAGSVCLRGPAQMTVVRTGEATVLAGIRRSVASAQAERPDAVRLADRIAAWFVSAVLVVAGLTVLAWWAVDPTRALEIGLAVLVVTCPCALSLATPAALAAAASRMASEGLMPVRAGAVEGLAHVDTLAMDKTGTLTEGSLQITQVRTAGRVDAQQALAWAAALERGSQHPIAGAFVDREAAITASEIVEHPGQGIEGQIDGQPVRLGRPDWVRRAAGPPPDEQLTWVALGQAGAVLAWFGLSDRIRDGAEDLVQGFEQRGIETAILSGDQATTVTSLAANLGVGEHHGRLSPEDKLSWIRDKQAGGRRVAMLGDGVNDGPVLGAASVGIAMGSGAALAQTTADLILPGHSLRPLLAGRVIAEHALHIIRQNLGWAIGYNLIALPLAVSGSLAPWMAALGMSFSSLVVVLNASRLARR